MNRTARIAAIATVAAALAACNRSPPASYKTEAVSRGAITEIVSATGDVEAIITVNIGSQVSGIVNRLYVDFNSKVKKGQVLAELDPRLFRAALEHADAALASAAANVQKAQAALDDSQRQLKRNQELFTGKLIAQADVDTAMANRDQNAAGLAGAKASVLQARADRDTAATNLALCKIASPIDGIVVSRAVDVGMTVAAAFQAPTLFTIANDLTKMQILANVDEADVGKVHEAQPARFTVDAYPGEVFRGSIRDLRQAPTTIQNVVTYAAVIDAPNPERKLRQGMTASIQITTDKHEDALRVANAALRFKPANAPETKEPGAPRGGERGERGVARASAGGGAGSGGGGAAGGGAAGGRSPAGGSGVDAAAPRADNAEPRPAKGRSGRVWKLVAGVPVAVDVHVGISDGQHSEVTGALAEGDEVILSEAGAAAAGATQRRRGFF